MEVSPNPQLYNDDTVRQAMLRLAGARLGTPTVSANLPLVRSA